MNLYWWFFSQIWRERNNHRLPSCLFSISEEETNDCNLTKHTTLFCPHQLPQLPITKPEQSDAKEQLRLSDLSVWLCTHCYLGFRFCSDQTIGESIEKISEITGTDSSVFTINNQSEYQDEQSTNQHHQVRLNN